MSEPNWTSPGLHTSSFQSSILGRKNGNRTQNQSRKLNSVTPLTDFTSFALTEVRFLLILHFLTVSSRIWILFLFLGGRRFVKLSPFLSFLYKLFIFPLICFAPYPTLLFVDLGPFPRFTFWHLRCISSNGCANMIFVSFFCKRILFSDLRIIF